MLKRLDRGAAEVDEGEVRFWLVRLLAENEIAFDVCRYSIEDVGVCFEDFLF